MRLSLVVAAQVVALFSAISMEVDARKYSDSLMLCLVNGEREQRGLNMLGPDGRLKNAAQRHSNDQAEHKHMTHDGTDGTKPSARIDQAGYDWRASAENVAYGYPDEQTCMKKWMASEGHRENILRERLTHFGSAVAYASDSRGTPYYTQVFAGDGKEYTFSRCPGESAPAPPPPPPPKVEPAPAPPPAPEPAPEPEPAPAPAPKPKPTKPRKTKKKTKRTKKKKTTSKKYVSVPAPPPPAPAPAKPVTQKPPTKKPSYMPKDWECIKKYTNGECHRWRKCTEDDRRWSCKEKWVGTP